MTVTDKSPKRFRFTLVSRLQNYALDVIHETETLETMVVTESIKAFLMTGTGLQGVWWLRSPGNNDNNAAFVNGENGNVNENGNNVKKQFGVHPALPDCQKCMEGSIRQCIGKRNPVPFLRRHPREKHMLESFQGVGSGGCPIPPAADWKNKNKDDYDR